jgi:hypothetical protein
MRRLINWKGIKTAFEKLFDPSRPRWIYVCICFLLITGLFFNLLQEKKSNLATQSNAETEESTDTYIPDGYALVPLEIVNALTVSNLMGRYTFVDIYNSSELNSRPKKIIAQNLRMLKSPHDDSQFAVLVRESEHDLIHNLSEPVFIVIKNPNSKNNETIISEKETVTKSKKSRISYGY